MNEHLLDIKEASVMLHLSVREINRRKAAGEISYVKIGKRTLFRYSALLAFIKRNEVTC
ncbi:MAG: helix-turn-helix domain-containing protein [Puniceicoccales bacterium]